MPTYIVAYVYLDFCIRRPGADGAARRPRHRRASADYWLPDIRSIAGCILLFGFVLYPYVYLSARAMFLMQSAGVVDVARTLGARRSRAFFRVALPLARPAIAVGASARADGGAERYRRRPNFSAFAR